MEKMFRRCMQEKGLLDPTGIFIDPLFTKKIMEYPNSDELKPPPINLYDKTKYPVNYV